MNWTVIGINYQKANLTQRQKYALNEDQISMIYQLFTAAEIQQALIISTCNRTEFFVPTESKAEAIDLVSKSVYQDEVETELFHCKQDIEAIQYFFRICCGLESQIAGDFEILGQVRKACVLAKKEGMISGTWERVINNALGAAKKARTRTGFYSGASSTSYAAIEYLRNRNIDLKNLSYLILGAGKIGSHTIDHLVKRVPTDQITIANRTAEKARNLADKKGLQVIAMDEVDQQADHYDVIICATNAPSYLLTQDHFTTKKNRVIIDLSVPLNVDPEIRELPGVELLNVDDLSKIVNENMIKREAEKENVEQIINEGVQDLNAWFTIKSGMPMLAELKDELTKMKTEALSNVEASDISHSKEFLDEYTDELFNQLSQGWIKKVRNRAVNAD